MKLLFYDFPMCHIVKKLSLIFVLVCLEVDLGLFGDGDNDTLVHIPH